MNAYEVMREWDRATGHRPRSNEDLDKEVPVTLGADDYESWKARLEAGDTEAIIKGMKLWGLPVEHLRAFEVDENILTPERPDFPES